MESCAVSVNSSGLSTLHVGVGASPSPTEGQVMQFSLTGNHCPRWGSSQGYHKSSGLWLGTWKGFTLPGPFSWIDKVICILGVWFRSELQLKKNQLEVQAKVGVAIWTWLWRPWMVGLRHAPHKSFIGCLFSLYARAIRRYFSTCSPTSCWVVTGSRLAERSVSNDHVMGAWECQTWRIINTPQVWLSSVHINPERLVFINLEYSCGISFLGSFPLLSFHVFNFDAFL